MNQAWEPENHDSADKFFYLKSPLQGFIAISVDYDDCDLEIVDFISGEVCRVLQAHFPTEQVRQGVEHILTRRLEDDQTRYVARTSGAED